MALRHIGLPTITLALLTTPSLDAASSHTWVAGNGNDANPCSVTQPCATFSTALTATTAGGTISVLSPGNFEPVSISKAVTIAGGAIGGAITFTGAEGILANEGTSDTVILRHLIVNGLNTGSDAIYLMQGRYVII